MPALPTPPVPAAPFTPFTPFTPVGAFAPFAPFAHLPPLGQTLPADDAGRMQRALALAARGFGLTEPNPRVGALIVSAGGQLLGEGHTQQAGGPHAEIVALRAAQAAGHDLRGATAYVTLEPCAHHGRTPPCCDALIAAGIRRVVAAMLDPYPQVAGRGFARLRDAGVQVDVGLGAEEARSLNLGFFSRIERGRPWVRMKVAASLDGRTALEDGTSQWITSTDARADGHAWRRRASAVLTGVGTVRDDDPRLDVRHVPTPAQPLRVVVDSRLEMSPRARILAAPGRCLVYAAAPEAARRTAIEAAGGEVVLMPRPGEPKPGEPNPRGKVDLAAMLGDLARRGVNELHVEAGTQLNGSFLREGLVDELLLYLAPMLIGSGRGLAGLGPYAALAQAPRLQFLSAEAVGLDLRVLARPVPAALGAAPST